MKFITDKIVWTEPMKEFVELTADRKLKRVAPDYNNNLNVTLAKLSNNTLKISLNLNSFRAQVVGEDLYVMAVEVFNKLQSIITKHSKKQISRNKGRQISMAELLPEEEEFENLELITKEKTFDLKPMPLENAVDEFERTDYEFYVFRDEAYESVVSIIYKRLNNTYGIIRCK